MIAFSLSINAQTGNKQNITGQVNNENNRPVDNATISLLRGKDSAMLKTALPDKEGKFEFENVKPGNYLVSISSVGYKKHFTRNFVIEEDGKTFTIAAIALQPASSTLAEVKVETRKPFIERKIDRLIVNVENSIISTGSTALEVLERSPGVMVNQESGINLKGKSGVSIMIDGKLSPLSGTDLITYLKSVPSDNIDRIEIITNPSAKYDASGNAGIIDIRFKKDKREGYNGNAGISLGRGVYSKPAANFSLNFRKKKWNVFTTDAVNAQKGLPILISPGNFSPTGTGLLNLYWTSPLIPGSRSRA